MQAARAGLKNWYLIDAKNMIVGRLAANITPLLIGKHKPTYSPGQFDVGDHVVIINAKHVHFTGDKWKRKGYRWHTGFPGGLKTYTAEQRHERYPTYVLQRAIDRMLPKNKLRKVRMSRLHVFPEGDHPFDSQQPVLIDPLGKDAIYSEIVEQ
jgi:large subunit ribosomal protein L13